MSRSGVGSRWGWTALVCAVSLILLSCLSQSSRTNPQDEGASSTNTVPSPTLAAPSTRHAPAASPSDPGSTSATSSLTTTMDTLRAALQRFDQSPPNIHGTFESGAPGEGVVLRDEVWIAWPAFRLEQRAKGGSGPLVVATSDGKRFGYRDPVSGEVGISTGLGERGFGLVPMVQYFGVPPAVCPAPDILTTESMMGRTVIHIGCDESSGWDQWIDVRTGLMLRKAVRRGEPNQADWMGYVQLEFGPQLDGGLFDPHSV